MSDGIGTALRDFLKNRDITSASSDLKKVYSKSKKWDNFIFDAKSAGFKWSQIYFVKEIFELYSITENTNLKWLILHVMYQYELGNLRTSIKDIHIDIYEWFDTEKPPFVIEDFLMSIDTLILDHPTLFGNGNEPFLLINDYIYINRIKKYETRFLELLSRRLDFVESENTGDDTISKALSSNFLIISGGPGTGKTTTILSIIKAFQTKGIKNIMLAAPTGRAAKRMVESFTEEMGVEAFTLHKLLGINPNSDKPRYNSERLIPADAVVVDEASMVDIHMMYRLFDALSPNTKLILVGDKDQLPSVEAGALLGDFLYNSEESNHKMNGKIVILNRSYRSTKGILDVAKCVINGDIQNSLKLMSEGSEVILKKILGIDQVLEEVVKEYSRCIKKSFKLSVLDYKNCLNDINEYFDQFSSFTLLTPTKKGLYGTYSLNSKISKVFNRKNTLFYHGQPIMITKNDYINGLYNGDRGVIFGFLNGLYAFFREQKEFKIISISKLSDFETSYAGTVHKSQGSEFEKVAIVIPQGTEKLLTREILYTAITRGKKHVTIYSDIKEIEMAISRKIKRESGIREFLID